MTPRIVYAVIIAGRTPPPVYAGDQLPPFVYATRADAAQVALAWNALVGDKSGRMYPFTVAEVAVLPRPVRVVSMFILKPVRTCTVIKEILILLFFK